MATPAEKKAISGFLFENPKNIEVAYSVYETWPSVRDQVCREFLCHLSSQIKENCSLYESGSDINIGWEFGENNPNKIWIWLFREGWKPFTTPADAPHPPNGKRTIISLKPDTKGPNNWFMNVRTPVTLVNMDDDERDRHLRMQDELNAVLGSSDGKTEHRYTWWRYVRPEFKNWESLIPRLHLECSAHNHSEITQYFVETFVEFAKKAIPVIDKIERAEY